MAKPENSEKKPYEKPAIVHTEVHEARATGCAGSDSTNPACAEGPIFS
jgi:hypothetical protein